MSRSGDECVVALTDQWYLVYGEQEWQAATAQALAQMEAYSEEAKHAFEHCLGETQEHWPACTAVALLEWGADVLAPASLAVCITEYSTL
jgi:leucyl-tRNA synthetase